MIDRPYVIRRAFILTCDSAWTHYQRGAIAVAPTGTIAWVGDDAQLPREYAGWTDIDGSGQVVMPGFVNTHTHAGLSTHRGLCDEGDLVTWAGALAPTTSTVTQEDIEAGMIVAVDAMLDAGVTCACDCTRYGAGVFADIASAMGLRSLSGALSNSPALRPAGRPDWPLALEDTIAAVDRHRDDPLARFFLGAHSPYSCTPGLVTEIAGHAKRLGLRFTIHLAETSNEVHELRERTGLSPAAWLDSLGALGPQTLLAHGVWLDQEDLSLISLRGASVAHCPTSNAKLGSGVAPVQQMLDLAIDVGLGTDSMLSNNGQDVREEMKTTVLLQRIFTGDATAMAARDVISMATIGGARALGWDDETGSLEVGKAADLVTVRMSHPRGLTIDRVMSDLVYASSRADIDTVAVAGRILRAKRPVHND
jgi:5-methylthioadenosine/S-adenosylhomocysteine deaminase